MDETEDSGRVGLEHGYDGLEIAKSAGDEGVLRRESDWHSASYTLSQSCNFNQAVLYVECCMILDNCVKDIAWV